MENENKRRDELNEELTVENAEVLETEAEKPIDALETVEETIEAEETVEETVDAAEEEGEETAEEICEEAEETVVEEAVEAAETTEPAEEVLEETENENVVMLSAEEVAEINAELDKRRKKNIKLFALIGAAVVVLAAIVAFMICYTEGVFGNNAVNKPISALTSETKKADNIRYQNPIAEVLSFDKESIMKIDGESVDKDVFQFFANSTGVNCVYSMIQMGMIEDVSDFDWDAIDQTSGLSYNELSKAMAIESLVPAYATIAEGQKRGIVFTEEDKKQIQDWIDDQKVNFRDEFETVLKKSGYADEDALFEVQKIQLYTQKVYDDIKANLDSYVTDSIKKGLDDDKVTVKHILIQAETEEEKKAAKEKAEMVLEKAKNGEEFEKLIEEYNEDPGMQNDPTGYTFAKDGTMVPEFEEASFKLKVGEISGIVETDYGYHVIKRYERAVTADDYVKAIGKKASVKIKKGVFDKMKVNIDLKDYFGAPAEEEAETEETDAN